MGGGGRRGRREIAKIVDQPREKLGRSRESQSGKYSGESGRLGLGVGSAGYTRHRLLGKRRD